MQFSVEQIALMLDGTVLGDKTLIINKLSKIEEAQNGAIAFFSNLKYEHFLYKTKASAVIIDKTFELKEEVSTTLILVENAYAAFTKLLQEYTKIIKFSPKGIESPTFINKESTLGNDCFVGAFSSIGKHTNIGNNTIISQSVFIGNNVTIGDNCLIYSGVRILDDTEIGSNCTFHSNVVVGSDGFGFAPQKDGSYETIPQIGIVIIEDNVSIGANTTIDRATMGATVIGQGVKIDNLCQVAHNVIIGKNTVMAAQSGIAGSTKVGEHCRIGGQVAINGHITVPNHTTIMGKSGVTKTFEEEGLFLSGFPATKNREALKTQANVRRLPEISEQVKDLAQKLLILQQEIQKD